MTESSAQPAGGERGPKPRTWVRRTLLNERCLLVPGEPVKLRGTNLIVTLVSQGVRRDDPWWAEAGDLLVATVEASYLGEVKRQEVTWREPSREGEADEPILIAEFVVRLMEWNDGSVCCAIHQFVGKGGKVMPASPNHSCSLRPGDALWLRGTDLAVKLLSLDTTDTPPHREGDDEELQADVEVICGGVARDYCVIWAWRNVPSCDSIFADRYVILFPSGSEWDVDCEVRDRRSRPGESLHEQVLTLHLSPDDTGWTPPC